MKYGIKIALALTLALFGSTGWGQSVFTKYGPQPGIQWSTGLDYHNTAATPAQVSSIFCSTSTSLFLRADGTCAVPAGTGVTSVGLTAPSVFTVTGSPVTSTGTLAVTFATGQTANQVLASPNGSSGAVALRALVGADIAPTNLGSTANGGVLSTSILLGTNGGTSNGFFSVTGPATSLKTFTFPNASATVLTTNAAVTVAQGGTGLATLTANGVLLGEGTSNITPLVMGADTVLRGTASADPVAAAVPNCGSSSQALSYNTTTHAFGCQSITGTATPGGATSNVQFNSSGSMAGDAGFTYTGSASDIVKLTGGSGVPANIVYAQSAAGADQKQVSTYYNYNGGAPSFNMTFLNDASSAENKFLSVTRGTGTAVTGITLGNATDLPLVATPGGIVASGGRPTLNSAASGIYMGGSTGGIAQFAMVDSAGAADQKMWDIFTDGIQLHFRADNDANSSAVEWLTVTRSGTTITNITGPLGASMFPASGTYTASYAGNGGVALTGTYARIGNLACITIPGSAVGASSATTFSMSGFPASVQPSTAQLVQFAPVAEDNGVIAGFTFSGTISGASITFQKNNSSTGWTASGQKGITTTVNACYLLN